MCALTRRPVVAAARLPSEVQVAGDLTNAGSLTDALEGVEAVFLLWPFLTSDAARTRRGGDCWRAGDELGRVGSRESVIYRNPGRQLIVGSSLADSLAEVITRAKSGERVYDWGNPESTTSCL